MLLEMSTRGGKNQNCPHIKYKQLLQTDVYATSVLIDSCFGDKTTLVSWNTILDDGYISRIDHKKTFNGFVPS